MTDAKFPAADPDDTEDVALALTTASSLWVSGEKEAAIRWLRKAQESANAAGSDARALELARAAADLTERVAAEDDTGPAPSDTEKTQLTKPPMPPPGPGARLHTAEKVAGSNGSNGASVDWGNGHSPEAGVTETTRGPILTQALRVCIKRSVRDDELFVARLLEDGQVPEGYCEALVVLTDPDQDLLDKLS
ncbi:MAG TPA: hypothetical protein VFU02_11920 [Polyangiaceae bacterium]|nr:hypothetical protein [Polyangiaceae bacterium]